MKEDVESQLKELILDFDSDIDNRYILYDSLIPVKKDKYWGFVNLSGKEVIKMEYDDFSIIYPLTLLRMLIYLNQVFPQPSYVL